MEELDYLEEAGMLVTKKFKNFRVRLHIINPDRMFYMKNNYYEVLFDENKEGFKSLEESRKYIESVFKKFPLGYCLDGDICQSVESLIDENWREVWNYNGINIHVWLENRKNAA